MICPVCKDELFNELGECIVCEVENAIENSVIFNCAFCGEHFLLSCMIQVEVMVDPKARFAYSGMELICPFCLAEGKTETLDKHPMMIETQKLLYEFGEVSEAVREMLKDQIEESWMDTLYREHRKDLFVVRKK